MPKNKVLISWSTGKDSAYALYQIRQNANYDVVGLFSTITAEYDRVAMHATRHELLKAQAEQVNLHLFPIFIPAACTNEIYKEHMQIFIEQAVQQGITHMVFGDLFLEDIRKYRESQLALTNITPLFPLWGKNTALLAREMISAGMKAIITCVDPKKLDVSFAGREFDERFLKDLPPGIDPCGENGEFHTFVYAGPMFCKSISISLGITVQRDGYIFSDIYHSQC